MSKSWAQFSWIQNAGDTVYRSHFTEREASQS